MKQKKAAALKYDKNYDSPIVTAIGFGHVAHAIIKNAEESNIPIAHNSELVESLSILELGAEIPPELYETVAKVIAFIYNLNKTAEKI